MTRAFELTALGGPWGRRLTRRRRWLDELRPVEVARVAPADVELLCALWTRTAFSEYASAAAFAEIATRLLASNAPIDLVAAAGEFVADEIVHCEAAARVTAWLGGAVPLTVDLARLVRPAAAADARLHAARLLVRTSCVGEALTVPMLKLARSVAGDETIAAVLGRIVADEASHAQLGWWYLDWVTPHLTDADRATLGRDAGIALRAFSPALGCEPTGRALEGFGAVACREYDPAFVRAVRERVVAPLAARGIEVPLSDREAVHASP